MITHLQNKFLTTMCRAALVCTTGASFIFPLAAQAKGTPADTIVEMSFSLDFALSGVEQQGITNSDNPVSFTVNRYESVTVSSMGDAEVVPNAVDQELLFSISNTGNDDQDYSLSVESVLGSDFVAENLEVFILVDDGDGVLEETENGLEFTLYSKDRTSLSSEVDGIIWVSVRGDMPTQSDMGVEAQSMVQLVATVITPDASGPIFDKSRQIISSRTSSGDIGSGTTGSDIGHFNMVAANIDVTASFTFHDDPSADCTDLDLAFNLGMAIPGACVEYNYEFQNADETNGIENVAFSSIMDPNFKFMTAEVVGFSNGSLQLPASNADCAVTTCQVAFNDAALPANTTATLRVRVKLK